MDKENSGFIILMIISGLIFINTVMNYKKEKEQKDKDFDSKSNYIYSSSIIFGGLILLVMLIIWIIDSF